MAKWFGKYGCFSSWAFQELGKYVSNSLDQGTSVTHWASHRRKPDWERLCLGWRWRWCSHNSPTLDSADCGTACRSVPWTQQIKLNRFQACNSMIPHLYIVLCVHHPKSSLLPSPFTPIPSFTSPIPSSLVSTMPLSESMSFCLIVCLFLLNPLSERCRCLEHKLEECTLKRLLIREVRRYYWKLIQGDLCYAVSESLLTIPCSNVEGRKHSSELGYPAKAISTRRIQKCCPLIVKCEEKEKLKKGLLTKNSQDLLILKIPSLSRDRANDDKIKKWFPSKHQIRGILGSMV